MGLRKRKSKYGRNEAFCNRYRSERRREKNKLRRVMRTQGTKAARAYAENELLIAYGRNLGYWD